MKTIKVLGLLLFVFVLGFSSITSYASGFSVKETEPEKANSQSEDEKQFDFKTFCWGDSPEDVKEVEGEPVYEGDWEGHNAIYIGYDRTIAGKEAILAYYFTDEGLCQTRYILVEEHSNESLYISDYEEIREAITKKYGEPKSDDEIWQNSSKKEYYASKKGDALCYGYLSYMTMYETDRTGVFMLMSADNYNISTEVNFCSIDITPGEADYSEDF